MNDYCDNFLTTKLWYERVTIPEQTYFTLEGMFSIIHAYETQLK